MSAESVVRSGEEQPLLRGIRDLGPAELFDFLEQCARLLPADARYRLRQVVQAAGLTQDSLFRAFEIVRSQWEGLQAGETVRIALVGPARTGKSALLGKIGEGDPARIATLFPIYDLQGLDEYLGYGDSERVYAEISLADFVILVLDGSSGFTEETVRLVGRLASLDRPRLLALNKIDLVEKPRQLLLESRRLFQMPVIPVSVHRPETIRRLLRAVVTACPRALYSMACQLPGFRRSICRGIVSQAAFGSGLLGAIPLPIGDLLPIAGVQVAMVLKIARAHGFSIDRRRARELVPVIAAGLVVREGARHLKASFPRQSRLISVGVAGAATYLIGMAAVQYFDRLQQMVSQSAGVREEQSTVAS